MSKFQVGDQVRLRGTFTHRGGRYRIEHDRIMRGGNLGTISKVGWAEFDNMVQVKWDYLPDDERSVLATDESCLELVEVVTDAEVAELFHLKSEIDWRRIFKEYADAVGDYEGVDFLTKIKVNWTEAEWEAVHELWDD